MSRAFAILLAVTAAIASVPPGSGGSDAQVIVVEIPASARQSPTPTPPTTPTAAPSPTAAPAPPAAASAGPRTDLPATGVDAAALAVAALLAAAALAVGILIRRRRSRA